MPIEGDNDGDGFMLFGVSDRLTNHLLMAQMDPVKNANRHAHFVRARPEFVGGMNDIHRMAERAGDDSIDGRIQAGALSADELQKRDDPLFQRRGGQSEDFFILDRVGDVELAHG